MSVSGAKMARLGSARLGSARLGSAVVLRLLFNVSSPITSNCQVKSESRVNCALFSDFFFCGEGGLLLRLCA